MRGGVFARANAPPGVVHFDQRAIESFLVDGSGGPALAKCGVGVNDLAGETFEGRDQIGRNTLGTVGYSARRSALLPSIVGTPAVRPTETSIDSTGNHQIVTPAAIDAATVTAC